MFSYLFFFPKKIIRLTSPPLSFVLGYGNLDPEFGWAHKGGIGIKAGLKRRGIFLCFSFSTDRGIGLAERSVVTLHYAGQLWTWIKTGESFEELGGQAGGQWEIALCLP